MPRPRSYEEKYPFSKGEITAKAEAPTLRNATARWLADVWYGNDREGMKKAERATNWLETTSPLGIATWLDDIGVSASEGDYKTAALTAALGAMPGPKGKIIKPTKVKPAPWAPRYDKTPGVHISPYDFDKFDWRKGLNTGEGTQNEGLGNYIMSPGNPMEHSYARQFERGTLINKAFDTPVDENTAYEDLWKFAEDQGYGNPKDAASTVLFGIKNDIKPGTEEAITPWGELLNNDIWDFAKTFYGHKKTGPHKYDVEMDFDKRAVPTLGASLKYQPKMEEIIDIIGNMFDPADAEISKGVLPRGPYNPGPKEYTTTYAWKKHFTPEEQAKLENTWDYPGVMGYGLSQEEADIHAMKRVDEYLNEVESNPLQYIAEYYRHKAPEEYSKRGIHALKYRDPDSEYKDPNFVVWNDDLIKILKKTALAAGAGAVFAPDLFGEDDAQQN